MHIVVNHAEYKVIDALGSREHDKGRLGGHPDEHQNFYLT